MTKTSTKSKGSKASYKKSGSASRRSVTDSRHASRSRGLLKERLRSVQNQLDKVWFDLYGSTFDADTQHEGEEE